MFRGNDKIRRGFLTRSIALLLTFAVSQSLEVLAQASRGCQFIGMAKTTATDIDKLSGILAAASGNRQVSFLPFEFNAGNPFGNATSLVQRSVPRVQGTLTMTVYAKWFPHDATGDRDQQAFWDAWAASNPSTAQKGIRNAFIDRISKTDRWISDTRRWASQNGFGGKVSFLVVPVLEDNCTSRAAYRNLMDAIRRQQSADGVTSDFRRSCLPGSRYVFSPALGFPSELHGRWADVRNSLGNGDAWSNDGTNYSDADFIRDQREANQKGVHVMHWNELYNGNLPRTRDNWAQRTVNPFTGSSGATLRTSLDSILKSR